MAEPQAVKISANLSSEVVEQLRTIARKRGISLTEALRRAIGTEKFLLDAIEDGEKVLIEGKDKKLRQIVLR